MRLSELVRFGAARCRAPAATTAERRRFRPQVERLEGREVPTVSANAEYVSVIYQGMVGHAPDANTLTAYTRLLDAGTPRLQVTSSILASPEYRGNAVEKLYENILGRPADLGSLNAFTQAMPNGTSLDDIRAELFGSDEFFARSGGNALSFLNALYTDILGRPADPTALAFLGQTQTSEGRTQLATVLLHTPEAMVRKTLDDFQVVLGQVPDLSSGMFIYNAYAAGNRDEGVLAFMLMSGQFYDPIAADSVTTHQTDPNAAAARYLNNTHLLHVGEPGNPGATPTAATLIGSPAVGPVMLPSGYNALGNVGLGTFGTGGFIPAGNGTGTNGTNGTGAAGTGTGTTTGTGTATSPNQPGFGTTGTGTTVGSGTGGGTTGTTGGTTGTAGGTTGTTGSSGTNGATGVGSGSGGTGLTGPGTPSG